MNRDESFLQESVTPAAPGYFLLLEDHGREDDTVTQLWAEPIVAWVHPPRNLYQVQHGLTSLPEPIGIQSSYEHAIGFLTPNGLVIQTGCKTWPDLTRFLMETYGKILPVHGAPRVDASAHPNR
jgi:hypothetical protein